MTGEEILQGAQRFVDEMIDEGDAVGAINEGISKLGDMALIYAQTEIAAAADTWYALPANLVKVAQVTDSDGYAYIDYSIIDGMISFVYEDSYTIHYRRPAVRLTKLDESPELHELFHPCLVDYLIGWWKLKEDDQSADGLRRMQEYRDNATRAYQMLLRNRAPSRVTVVR